MKKFSSDENTYTRFESKEDHSSRWMTIQNSILNRNSKETVNLKNEIEWFY